MDKFTKKELKEIKRCLKYFIKNNMVTYYSPAQEIKNKIQDMLDYYDCEVIKCWHCEKCGHVQGGNNE